MSKSSTDVETAQLLLREIGREPLLTYFSKRLEAGKDLASRPFLITAFAQLAGPKSSTFLSRICSDEMESPESRAVATKLLGIIAKQFSDVSEQSGLASLLIELLRDDTIEVRSAAAIQLTRLEVNQALPLLRQLVKNNQLDVLALTAVQKFLDSVQGLSTEFFADLSTRPLISRNKELTLLTSGFTKSQIVTLVGLPGIGKTILAAQFAKQARYDVKIWRSSTSSFDLSLLATDILKAIVELVQPDKDVSKSGSITDAHFELSVIEAEIAHLLEDRSTLLVLDEYEAMRESAATNRFIENLVTRLPKLNCLIVGRIIPQFSNAVEIKLEAFSPSDSVDWLRTAASSKHIDLSTLDAERIAEISGGHPLMAQLLLSYLSQGNTLDETPINKEREAFSLILEQSIKVLSESERRALEIFSQFEEPIPFANSELNKLFTEEQIVPLLQVLESLSQRSLIDFTSVNVGIVPGVVREFINRRTNHRTILRINGALGQYYRGQQNILRAAAHYIRAEMSEEAALLIAESSRDLINQGHVHSALELINSNLLKVELSPKARLRLFHSIGNFSRFIGDYLQAIKSYEEATKIARELSDERTQGLVANNLGLVHVHLGEFNKAETYLLAANAIAQNTDETALLSRVLENLTLLEVNRGNFDSALQYTQQGLMLARKLGDLQGVSRHLMNAGLITERQGDFLRAEDYLQEASDFARQLDDRQLIVTILKEQGELSSNAKKFELAASYLQEGLTLARDLQDKINTAFLLSSLSEVLLALGDFRHAKEYTSEALSIAREINDLSLALQVLYQSGTIHLQQGDLIQAKKSFLEGLELAERMAFREMSGQAYYGLALVAVAEGYHSEALSQAQKSLRIFEKLGHYRAKEVKELIEKISLDSDK